MTPLTITIDEQTAQHLRQMAQEQGINTARLASRLLLLAIRAARPRPVYDIVAMKAAYAEFAEEDVAMAEATAAEHAALLAYEDRA